MLLAMSKLRLSHVAWFRGILPMYLGLSPGSIFNEFRINLVKKKLILSDF